MQEPNKQCACLALQLKARKILKFRLVNSPQMLPLIPRPQL